MKYLKKFEDVSYINNDGNVVIKKYHNGDIVFVINGAVKSLSLGVFILLDTKYENDEDIRNIKIINKPTGPALNNNATRKSVLNIINQKYNWNIGIENKLYKLINFRKMFEQSNTIGDLFDNARKTIINELSFHFDVQKYNL